MRKGFVHIRSSSDAGPLATKEQETEARPAIEGTIPIHADFVMAAGTIGVDDRFRYTIGGADREEVIKEQERKVYVHLPMTKGGAAKIRLDIYPAADVNIE